MAAEIPQWCGLYCVSLACQKFIVAALVRPIEIQFSAISTEWDLKRLFSLVCFKIALDIEIYI